MVGVALNEEGVALAAVSDEKGERPRLRFYEQLPAHSADERHAALTEAVQRHKLTGARCSLLLCPGRYQLLRAEAPQVEPSELREAMRWRIKDMIDFPPEQATVDVFPVPGQREGERGALVYVAATRREPLGEQVHLLREAGLVVEAVDIYELALRNLAALLPSDGEGGAVLRLDRQGGETLIYRREALYLSRDLNLSREDLIRALGTGPLHDFLDLPPDGQHLLDHLVLEIQRSLDYYESHFSLPAPKHLALLPQRSEVEILPHYLRSMLGVEVATLDLNQLLELPEPMTLEEQRFAIGAVGAALRDWERAA